MQIKINGNNKHVSGNIEAAFLQLGTTKETKWHCKCCSHDNSFATGAVLMKAEIPSFCPTPKTIYPTQSNDGVKTIYGNYVSSNYHPLAHFRGFKWE